MLHLAVVVRASRYVRLAGAPSRTDRDVREIGVQLIEVDNELIVTNRSLATVVTRGLAIDRKFHCVEAIRPTIVEINPVAPRKKLESSGATVALRTSLLEVRLAAKYIVIVDVHPVRRVERPALVRRSDGQTAPRAVREGRQFGCRLGRLLLHLHLLISEALDLVFKRLDLLNLCLQSLDLFLDVALSLSRPRRHQPRDGGQASCNKKCPPLSHLVPPIGKFFSSDQTTEIGPQPLLARFLRHATTCVLFFHVLCKQILLNPKKALF